MTPQPRTGADIFADRVEYWISTPRATFGITAADGIVTRTAPIAKRWAGKPISDALDFYRSNGGEIAIIGHSNPKGKKPCAVCGVYDFVDPCRHCRDDLPGLLARLNEQRQRIINSLAVDTLALETAIKAASDDEMLRYQRLLLARQATIGKPGAAADFNRRYVATQKSPDGLGSIARAMARLDTEPARTSFLVKLESSITAVQTAMKEGKNQHD